MKARRTKDYTLYREADVAKTQKEIRHGSLQDLRHRHTVELRWDLNEDAIRDQVFLLKIDDIEVMLDSEQLQRLLRWV